MELDRGDIALVNFNPARSGEIGKLRPAIIMSLKEELQILDTAIVIPLSSIIEKNATPYRYKITKKDDLKKDSDACVYEIRALSKDRIKQKISKISSKELKEIQKFLCQMLS